MRLRERRDRCASHCSLSLLTPRQIVLQQCSAASEALQLVRLCSNVLNVFNIVYTHIEEINVMQRGDLVENPSNFVEFNESSHLWEEFNAYL